MRESNRIRRIGAEHLVDFVSAESFEVIAVVQSAAGVNPMAGVLDDDVAIDGDDRRHHADELFFGTIDRRGAKVRRREVVVDGVAVKENRIGGKRALLVRNDRAVVVFESNLPVANVAGEEAEVGAGVAGALDVFAHLP